MDEKIKEQILEDVFRRICFIEVEATTVRELLKAITKEDEDADR